MANSFFIVDGVRTLIGSPHKSLKDFSAAGLAAFVISELSKRNKIKKTDIDQVIVGNAVSAGTGQNLARQAALLAKLSADIPSYTVNSVCGSGLQAVICSLQAIAAGDAKLCIAAGAESATHYPFFMERSLAGKQKQGECFDSLKRDGLFCSMTGKVMGDLVEDLSVKYKISRREQDQYALRSHQKAIAAQKNDLYSHELISLKLTSGKVFNRDDRPRKNIDLSIIGAFPPAFKKKGTVTSGNSSVPCDGAAAVLVANQETVQKLKLKPKAEILGYSSISIEPSKTFEGSVKAIQDVCKKSKLEVKDIDLFELSESFAAQALYVQKKLAISDERWNICGGDIALGHPLGAAGTRCLVSLIYNLMRANKKTGVTAVDYGGGGAIAMAIRLV